MSYIFKITTQKMSNTVHNLITFPIVFINKKREGGFDSPNPPIQTKINKEGLDIDLAGYPGFLKRRIPNIRGYFCCHISS